VTLSDARQILRAKPRFGDDSQIKADRFLVRAEEQFVHLVGCRHCQNHDECPEGWNARGDVDLEDAAFALIDERGGIQEIIKNGLLDGTVMP
jgi:hypothetical protein